MPTSNSDTSDQDQTTRRSVRIALAANVVIVTVKIIAGILTRFPASLSEAAHSAADTLNEVFLLIAVAGSQRDAYAAHPFGYGKARYFYVMLAAMGISVTGACFWLYQAIATLVSGIAHTDLFALAYTVLAISCAADGISLVRATRQSWIQVEPRPSRLRRLFGAERDPALSTVLTEDSTAVAGVILAAGGLGAHQFTGDGRYEGIASLLIAVLLGYAAIRLGHRSEALIIGQAADPALVRDIYLALDAREEVDMILELLTMRMGPDAVLLAVRVGLAGGFDSGEVEAASGRITHTLHVRCPVLEQIFLDITDATDEDRDVAARRRRQLIDERGRESDRKVSFRK
ncbi:cation diffusion facilitator family transporter [Rothia uropygialis]|uniref:cation diffusion facilitator family transporter n=1 Tax=Kocuria sp. 36 TaxID=1415402 RepID=UPI00101D6D8C|nr:cation diffusion facilitator family transporter [Kocuria sp. 36]